MSFTITKTMQVVKSYPEFGILFNGDVEQKSVQYTAEALSSLSSTMGTAIFKVQIDGINQPGTFVHDFIYSGDGNPLDEAEKSLLKYLENLT